jgi:hypothetical protein
MWWLGVALAATPGTTCWDGLARAHVRAGEVDYAALRGPARPALDGCVAELASVSSMDGWTRAEQVAWWVNAYNAWTVLLVVDNPGIASIRDLGWPLSSPWKKEFVPLGALGARTLDDIEHGILRKRYADPRLHAVLVCASRSCPALRSEAYTADRLEAQLDEAAALFLADPTKNRLEGGTLKLSKIFSWYGADFDGVGGVRGFVRKHGPAAWAPVVGTAPVEFLVYDWSLNGK